MRNIITLAMAFTFICACSSKGQYKMDFTDFFQSTCIGRYQMDLPTSSFYTAAYYNDQLLRLGIGNPLKKPENTKGLLTGFDRHTKWAKLVTDKFSEDGEYHPEYVDIPKSSNIEVLAYYHPYKSGREYDTHFYETFLLKDFPKQEFSVSARISNKKGFYQYQDSNHRIKFHNLVDTVTQHANQLIYQPWPHNQLGVCLNNQLLLNTQQALDDENFKITYFSGPETRFTFEFAAYPKHQAPLLDKKMSNHASLVSLFASEHLTVGGRAGRLFVSLGRYSDDVLDFAWIASDAKAGSTRKPYMRIRGSVQIADFPELEQAGITNEDLLVVLLQSMQVRENGMLGAR